MDFNSLVRGSLPTFAVNMTGSAKNSTKGGLDDSIIENLMPLLGGRVNPLMHAFMLLYNMVGSRVGVDPTVILTAMGFFWATNKLWAHLYTAVYGFIQEYLTTSVHINGGDEIYLHLMKWLASQPYLSSSRSLMAESTSRSAWDEEENADVATAPISADGSGIYLNFSRQEAKSPPRFIPALGTHGFWFEGRYFRLHRKQESFYDDGATGSFPMFKDREKLIVSCYGRSPEPIKCLLRHAKRKYYDDHHAMTMVKRPSPQNVRRYGGRHSWVLVANRPVRPMKTVVLDAKQKVQVLSDMNEYLHPATPRWYANRGIPLRRGYLFHGPPGTGKTSLSFALAGVFGLDIYVISLLEPSLTEEDLSGLFSSLPRRCVVLLEDIDTAGLSRPKDDKDATIEEEESKNAKEEDAAGGAVKLLNDWKVADLARELKKYQQRYSSSSSSSSSSEHGDDKKGISLSGLLNAIDGVASHEGRVLIMTTNKPESLDDALIRPGRVDLQVAFTYATQSQARELFERMYEADRDRRQASSSSAAGSRPHGRSAQQTLLPREFREFPSTAPLPDNPVVNPSRDAVPRSKVKPNGNISATGEMNGSADTASTTPKADGGADDADDQEGNWSDGTAVMDLAEVASEFASKIPDGQFSPAEIQGFLLKRKKSPQKALEDVDSWAKALQQQKASKTKVLRVQ